MGWAWSGWVGLGERGGGGLAKLGCAGGTVFSFLLLVSFNFVFVFVFTVFILFYFCCCIYLFFYFIFILVSGPFFVCFVLQRRMAGLGLVQAGEDRGVAGGILPHRRLCSRQGRAALSGLGNWPGEGSSF